MSQILLTAHQAAHPEELPPHCMRCNAGATDIVARPVGNPPRERGSGWGAPLPATDTGMALGGLGLALALIFGGLERLRTGQRWLAKAVWLFVLLVGLATAVVAVAALRGVKVASTVWLLLAGAVLVSFAILTWQAGHDRTPVEGSAQALIPVCARHRSHWRVYQRVVVGLSLGSVAYLVGLAVVVLPLLRKPAGQNDHPENWILLGLLGLMAIIGAVAFFFRAPIQATRSEGGTIVVDGVSAEYAKALPPAR